MTLDNWGDPTTHYLYKTLKRTRLHINTIAEIRKNNVTGHIYFYAYGHLHKKVSGQIDRLTYKMLTKGNAYKLIDGWIVHIRTNQRLRQLELEK